MTDDSTTPPSPEEPLAEPAPGGAESPANQSSPEAERLDASESATPDHAVMPSEAGHPAAAGDVSGEHASDEHHADDEHAGDEHASDEHHADDEHAGDEHGDEEHGETESSSGDVAAAGGTTPDGKKKRRRRRRRGAGTGTTSPGSEAAAQPGHEGGAAPKATGGVFGKLIDATAGRGSAFELGVSVAGRVVRIAPDVVFLDLFGKTDAYMLGEEAHDENGQPLHRPGEMVKNVKVVSVAEDGRVVVSGKPVDEAAAVARVEARAAANEPVIGMVYGLNRGGFDIWLDGVRAFCPASQISMRPIDDPESFLGRRGEFVISDLKPGGKDIVVTRRPIIQKDQEELATRVRATLQPGTVVKGHVVQVKDFGAFVDLGGVEGFVHVSELSWERVDRAQDVLRPNEEIEVVVLRIPGARPGDPNDKRERPGRIPLSLKALRDDPWKQVANRIKVGEKRTGKVVRTAEFGAFVELEPGIDGLLHVSELGRSLKHAKEAVQEGASIDVIVERVDPEARRVSLSKWSEAAAGAAGDGPAIDPRSIRAGAILDVKVEKIEPMGLQVQIVGVVGKRGRGFLSAMETGTPKGTDLRKSFPVGSSVKVKVVGFEKDGRVKLSRRAMLRDEEREAFHSYRSEVAKKGFGTFGDLLLKAQAKSAPPEPEPDESESESEPEIEHGESESGPAHGESKSAPEQRESIDDSPTPNAEESPTDGVEAEAPPDSVEPTGSPPGGSPPGGGESPSAATDADS